MQAIDWIVANMDTLIQILGLASGIASLITGLTNSPKDDEALAKVKAVAEKLSFLTHKDAKGTLKLPFSKVR